MRVFTLTVDLAERLWKRKRRYAIMDRLRRDADFVILESGVAPSVKTYTSPYYQDVVVGNAARVLIVADERPE